jgi:EAL and modified HD-GYP domain-containing signal transduction protein
MQLQRKRKQESFMANPTANSELPVIYTSKAAAPAESHAHDFFLARQPILNREQELIAYELLFRNTDNAIEANITTNLAATATVMSHISQLGFEKVVGEALGFINVDAAVLKSDIFHLLPCDKVVLEIVETVKATPDIVARITELAQAGFRFALDDVISESEDVKRFLPFAHIIKIDLQNMSFDAIPALARRFKALNKQLLAEKVETLPQFQSCLELGFDYFQGYYFAKPLILSGKKLMPSQLTLIQLLALMKSNASDSEIEHAVKHDVSLSISLLRSVNALISTNAPVDSLNQALQAFGRGQLQCWLQIMLYSESCRQSQCTASLLIMAATRGKLLELMAERLHPEQRSVADKAFTVGLMSLMDSLLELPMAELLKQMPVIDEVSDALLFRKGLYGDLLQLAEHLEQVEDAGPKLSVALQNLHLTSHTLYQMELEAYEWSNRLPLPS